MLVLSARPDESIHLPGLGEIFVLEIRDGKVVRLGLQFPDVIRIYRQKVWADILDQCQRDPELRETWRRHLERWPHLLSEMEQDSVPRKPVNR